MKAPRIAPVLSGALLLFGCSTESPSGPAAVLTQAADHIDASMVLGHLKVCKEGSAATIAVNGSGLPFANHECKLFDAGTYTVEEIAAENGYQFDRVVVFSQVGLVTSTLPPSTTPKVENLKAGNDQGHVVTFYNVAIPGGQGCTPGYWKQSQHFDSWVGYTPGQTFASAGFADVFSGKTLLQVLGQGGGGLNALGRHAVAALLNAASPGVASGTSTAGVIAAFNAASAGGGVEAQKNVFEALNEQGCPLN